MPEHRRRAVAAGCGSVRKGVRGLLIDCASLSADAKQPRHILVAVAWPYANGSLHLGHIAGAYLPADIFARYHRMAGNHVLMVSGSDQHGTPVTVRAENESTTPQAIIDQFHPEFLRYW